jgi:methyl-accepting chemotaxis protein
MNNKKNAIISVAMRMAISFAIVLAMMLLLAVFSISEVRSIGDSLRNISENNNVKEHFAANFRGSVHDRAIAIRDIVLVPDDQIKDVAAQIEKLDSDYRQSAQPLEAIFGSQGQFNILPEEHDEFLQIKADEAKVAPQVKAIIDARIAGDIEGARRIMLMQGKPALAELLASINKFVDTEERLSKIESEHARSVAKRFQRMMLGLLLVALFTGIVLATLITRFIRRTLGAEPDEVRELALAVDRGELYHQADLRGNDGIGKTCSIMATLADMSKSLRETVKDVRDAATDIAEISGQIAEENRHLSGRTEEQASSLEETASAMEQLTSTVKQNVANAKQAKDAAETASGIAVQGGAIVGEVVQTMGLIDESSRKIVDIITVIDSIAFQTNILALNAAVEAARAGEQGRGFAVVATEVRSLAQRSSAAAKEVKQLIDNSVEKVQIGTRLVETAGNTMTQIVESVRHVTDMVGQISVASSEQGVGIEEVHRAIALMDAVTQQNATLVEQATVACEILQDQAQNLKKAVGVFQLDEHVTAPASMPFIPVIGKRGPMPMRSLMLKST